MWTILLIDDDEDDYILTRELLANAREGNYSITWKKDYSSGLEAAVSGRFDAILIDNHLGYESGLKLIEEINQQGIQSPMIMLTGMGGYKVDLEVLQAGAVDYLDKKYLTTALLEKSIRYAIQQKKTEEDLRQERARLQAIIQQAPIGILFTNQEGEFTLTNPALEQIMRGGLTGTAAGPESDYTLNHIDGTPFLPEEMPLIKSLREGEGVRATEMVLRRDNGVQVFLRANSNPIYSSDGRLAGAVAVIQDISSEKQAELDRAALLDELSMQKLELERQSDLLERMFQLIPGGLILVSRENGRMKYLKANPAYQLMTPYPEMDLAGHYTDEIWPPEQCKKSWEAFRPAFEEGRVVEVEKTIITYPDGSTRYYSFHLTPLKIDGEPVVLQVLWEITQQELAAQKARQAAEEAQARAREAEEGRRILQALMEYIPEGIGIAEGPDVKLRMVSQYDQIITGRGLKDSPRIVDGNEYDLWKIFYPGGTDPVPLKDYPLHLAIDGGKVVKNQEYLLQRKDGQLIPILCNFGPIRDEQQRITGAVVAWRDIHEVKQAEAEREQLLDEIRAERDKLQAVVQNAPVGIAILQGPEYRIALANSIQLEFFGNRTDIIGKTPAEIWPGMISKYQDILDQVYQSGEVYRIDEVAIKLDRGQGQEEGFFNFICTPIRGSGGAVESLLVLSVETTASVRLRQSIEADQNRLKAVLEQMPCGVVIAEAPSGRLIMGNEQMEKIWRESLSSSKNQPEDSKFPWQNIPGFHPDGSDYQQEEWPIARSLGQGEMVSDEEIRFQRQDGSFGTLLVNSAPIRTMNGQINAAVSVFYDISERKELIDAQRRSDQRFQISLACAPIIVFTLDLDMRFTSLYNSQTGFTQEPVVGKRYDQVLTPADPDSLTLTLDRVVEEGARVREEITLLVNGNELIYAMTFEPLHDIYGLICGVTAAGMDVTDLRVLQAEKIQHLAQIDVQRRLIRQRETERLQVARALHDGPFQTLNAANIGLMDAIFQESDPEHVERLEWVQKTFKQQIQEMRQFIQELRPPALVSFGLETTIRSHVESFRAIYPDISVELALMRDGKILPEETRLTLYRIYQEIMSNVGKHADAKHVKVSLIVEDTRLVLEVEDDGVGFEVPERWADLALSEHLGLISIRERVDMIGGKLEIQSQAGQGTNIRVSILVETPEQRPLFKLS